MGRRTLPLVLVAMLSLGIVPTASADTSFVNVTIDRIGSVSQSEGLATVRGTAVCQAGTGTTGQLTADVRVEQRIGPTGIEGYAVIVLDCDGSWHAWHASGISSNRVDDHGNGLFKPGRAEASIAVVLTDSGEDVSVARGIQLRPWR